MHGLITPGLASLVVQTQVFFTVILAAVISRERLRAYQMVALAIAFSGLLIIWQHTDATTTIIGLVLVLAAAMSWALSNIIVRATPNVDMLAYVVWGSMFAPLPLFALSYVFEGWPAIQRGLANATTATWASVAWQSLPYLVRLRGVERCRWPAIRSRRSLRCRCWCPSLGWEHRLCTRRAAVRLEALGGGVGHVRPRAQSAVAAPSAGPRGLAVSLSRFVFRSVVDRLRDGEAAFGHHARKTSPSLLPTRQTCLAPRCVPGRGRGSRRRWRRSTGGAR